MIVYNDTKQDVVYNHTIYGHLLSGAMRGEILLWKIEKFE